MQNFRNVSEALIEVKDGALNITIGNINKVNTHYHNRVSIDFENGGTEIRIAGHQLRSENLSGEITEDDDNFIRCCKYLKDFESTILTREIKKFSWKTFKREVVKKLLYVTATEHYYREKRYIYKEEFWAPQEYKTNNWLFIEFKKEIDDTRNVG